MFNAQRCVARETTDIIRGPGGGKFSLPEIIPFTSQGFFFTSFVYPDLSPRPRPELGPHKRGRQNDPKREWGASRTSQCQGNVTGGPWLPGAWHCADLSLQGSPWFWE